MSGPTGTEIQAAVTLIERVVVRLTGWQYVEFQHNYEPFMSELRILREAVELLRAGGDG